MFSEIRRRFYDVVAPRSRLQYIVVEPFLSPFSLMFDARHVYVTINDPDDRIISLSRLLQVRDTRRRLFDAYRREPLRRSGLLRDFMSDDPMRVALAIMRFLHHDSPHLDIESVVDAFMLRMKYAQIDSDRDAGRFMTRWQGAECVLVVLPELSVRVVPPMPDWRGLRYMRKLALRRDKADGCTELGNGFYLCDI